MEKICLQAALELKKKVSASRTLCVSHFEAVQNVARLHKAGSNAALDELSALASSNSHSIGEVRNVSHIPDVFRRYSAYVRYNLIKSILQLLAAEDVEMNSVFYDLQQSLSNHQGEMVDLARELRQVYICNLLIHISTS